MMITDFYNKYDYVQCLLTMIGMKGANCSYDCLWCTIAKDARYACIISVTMLLICRHITLPLRHPIIKF